MSESNFEGAIFTSLCSGFTKRRRCFSHVPWCWYTKQSSWTPLSNICLLWCHLSLSNLPPSTFQWTRPLTRRSLLISEAKCGLFIRGKRGETEYGVAAAVLRFGCCEVCLLLKPVVHTWVWKISFWILQDAKAERWRGVTALYNPRLVHTAIPLVLYDNQWLNARLKATEVVLICTFEVGDHHLSWNYRHLMMRLVPSSFQHCVVEYNSHYMKLLGCYQDCRPPCTWGSRTKSFLGVLLLSLETNIFQVRLEDKWTPEMSIYQRALTHTYRFGLPDIKPRSKFISEFNGY